jgi:polygalacturonase
LKDLEGKGESCGSHNDDNSSTATAKFTGQSATETRERRNDNTKNAIKNAAAFTRAFHNVKPGDTVLVPDGKSFTLLGGVIAQNLNNFTLDIAGSIHFIHDPELWPTIISPSTFFNNTYQPGISIVNCTNVTLTSSSKTKAKVWVDMKRYMVRLVDSTTHRGGIINGNGKSWWDDVISGRMNEHIATRPRLIHLIECEDVLVEKLTLLNSPYWTLTVEAVRAEIKFVNVIVDREVQSYLYKKHEASSPGYAAVTEIQRQMESVDFPIPIDDLPDWVGRKMRQPQDLNTDGIDAFGKDIWIHDCIIQNADDSIAVKPSRRGRNGTRIPDCTTNVTMTNLVLTGFGASVGSVGPHRYHNCVDKITFKNITMPGTAKGIYIKSNGASCINQSSQITNILYENVDIIEPYWWAIWIGPQQQHQPGDKLGYNVSV